MRIFDSWWSSVVYFFNLATFSPFSIRDAHQQALLKDLPSNDFLHGPVIQPIASPTDHSALSHDTSKGPIIYPPYLPDDVPGPGFAIKCDYSRMGRNWTNCNSPDNRGCWLRGPKGEEYNIKTNYEKYAPLGIKRKYFLDVTERALVPDGIAMPYGKVFNNTYPGPWSKLSISLLFNSDHLSLRGTACLESSYVEFIFFFQVSPLQIAYIPHCQRRTLTQTSMSSSSMLG